MKSKKYKGGVLKREEIEDPTNIHKLRLIELSGNRNLIEYKDHNNMLQSNPQEIVNILYVIDMQNDFIKPPGPNPTDGQFSVLGGDSVANELIQFIQSQKSFFDKIIFSLDYHKHDHCAFHNQKGIHPPHCIQKSHGASFDDRIKKLLENNLLSDKQSSDYKKTEIVFKAMEMESFGASISTMKDKTKWYETHQQSCKVQCQSNTDCLNLTGGFQINPNRTKLDNLKNNITTKDLQYKYDIGDIILEIGRPNCQHNIYITGLAGCHCVSETATNIADYLKIVSDDMFRIDFKYQIYIIESLTRHAFVPLSISAPQTFSKENITERLRQSKNKKDDLSFYIFKMNQSNKYKLLTNQEVKDETDEIEKCAESKLSEDNFAKYHHYLVPLNETIDKYLSYQGKIKLIMKPGDDELTNNLRLAPSQNAGKNKKKSKKKNHKLYPRL